jgi:exonuclease SbcD
VNLNQKGGLELQLCPLMPRHDLRSIRGTFEELTSRSFYEGTATDDYLHALLTDEEDVPEAVGKLRVIYPNLMKLSYDNTRTRTNQVIDGAEDVRRKSPLELFDELYELQNNQPMSEEQHRFVQELIESVWEDRV